MARNSSGTRRPTSWLPLGNSQEALNSRLLVEEPTERTPLSRDVSPAPKTKILSKNDSLPSAPPTTPVSSISPTLERISTSEDTPDQQTLRSIKRRLYISHFLSTWNFRGFEFGAVLFLATIFPGTLLPMSIYALIRAASAIVLAPSVGRYIDRGERLKVIRASIVWQRSSVVISCVLFGVMLTQKKNLPAWSIYVLLSANILLACIEKICAMMNTVSVERDWVIVIAQKNESILKQMNSQMRRIDLFCKLVSPLIIALLDGVSTEIAILVTFGINTVSMMLEYGLIAKVYKLVPALANRGTPSSMDEDEGMATQPTQSNSQSSSRRLLSLIGNLRVYGSQGAFLPSLSLSILYLTVLSFAGQMVTYLLSVGYTSTVVGLIRMVSTIFELSATWLAPRVMNRIGPVRSGIWFLSLQMICLGIAVTVFWTAKKPFWAATGLVGGTILSRVGLWGFDLSAQVIIQEEVEPEFRGAFSTTEAALQNFFELCAYTSTIVFFKPSQFKYPSTLSIVAVYIAGALYAKFVRDRRGHLLHRSRCMKPRHERRSNYERIGQTL